MERCKHRVILENGNNTEISLEVDSYTRCGENSIEFILGGQSVLCLNFKHRIIRVENLEPMVVDATASTDDHSEWKIPYRIIDLVL